MLTAENNVSTENSASVALSENVTVANMPTRDDVQADAPVTPTATIDVSAIQRELTDLRKLYVEHEDANSDARRELNETVQNRLYKFLERGIKQARVLIQDDHMEVLRDLVEGIDEDNPGIGETLAPTDGGRMNQIARLQIGYRCPKGPKKGKWLVPARRDERIAHLYAIIIKKGWSDKGLAAKIKEAGGAAKLIKSNPKRVSAETIAAVERRKKLVAKDQAAPFVPDNTITPGLNGEFRLAIVSCHPDGVKYHQLAPIDGAARDRVLNEFLKTRYEELLIQLAEQQEAAEDAAA